MAESRVELSGFEARHYDTMLNWVSFGTYAGFIKEVIAALKIQPSDQILDLGCGTGRNSCLMAQYLDSSGSILGLDIGEEMMVQFKQNCQNFPNVKIQNLRIDEPLPFKQAFDKVFLSFVFHGFPDDKKAVILENVIRALKPDGKLLMLDYNEFDLQQKSWFFRKAFTKIECRLAQDYLKVDWKANLAKLGFRDFEEVFFYRGIVRLLKANLKNEA